MSLRDLPSLRLLSERWTRLALAPFLVSPMISVKSGVEREWEREPKRWRANESDLPRRSTLHESRSGPGGLGLSLSCEAVVLYRSSADGNLRRNLFDRSSPSEGSELMLTLFSETAGEEEVLSGLLDLEGEDLRIGACLSALRLVTGEKFLTIGSSSSTHVSSLSRRGFSQVSSPSESNISPAKIMSSKSGAITGVCRHDFLFAWLDREDFCLILTPDGGGSKMPEASVLGLVVSDMLGDRTTISGLPRFRMECGLFNSFSTGEVTGASDLSGTARSLCTKALRAHGGDFRKGDFWSAVKCWLGEGPRENPWMSTLDEPVTSFSSLDDAG